MNSDLNQDSARAAGADDVRQDYVVGIDAGGTRTRAVLAPAHGGDPLGEGVAGPGNALSVPVPELTDHLAEALARAVPEGLRTSVVAVAGGFAGASRTAEDEPGRLRAHSALTAALHRLGIDAASVEIHSDIEAAFASAPGHPADGLALVAGTGAVAARITGRLCTATAGGDGWLLGDDGSGFWIGREAVRAALRMADGRGGPTSLAASVGRASGVPGEVLPDGASEGRRHGAGAQAGGAAGPPYAGGGAGRSQETGAQSRYGSEDAGRSRGDGRAREPYPGEAAGQPYAHGPEWTRARREAYRMRLLPAVMDLPPVRLARLAPLVAEAARSGDAVAEGILDEAAGHLLGTVRALAPRPGERVVATGGLLGPDGPLTAPLTARLHPLGLTLDWVADGSPGAVALARLGI